MPGLWERWRRRPRVLVIGSAHLDVYGDFAASERNRRDREGEVYCALGGTAFNIAIDLATGLRVRSTLFTHIRARSPISDMLVQRLKDQGVSVRHVQRDKKIERDSGFVAHRCSGELVAAVSAMPIEGVTFRPRRLERAIGRTAVVVADCNLSAAQLALVVELCAQHRRPLIVAGVSESKCLRVKVLPRSDTGEPRLTFLCVNGEELKAFLHGELLPSAQFSRAVCDLARAKYVLATKGEGGLVIHGIDGSVHHFEAPKTSAIRSTSGTGDAVVAAIADLLARCGGIDWRRLESTIHSYVDRCLRSRAPSGNELNSVETLALAHEGIVSQLRRGRLRARTVVAALIASASLAAGLIQAAVSLENSNVVWPTIKRAYASLLGTTPKGR